MSKYIYTSNCNIHVLKYPENRSCSSYVSMLTLRERERQLYIRSNHIHMSLFCIRKDIVIWRKMVLMLESLVYFGMLSLPATAASEGF